MFDWNKVALLLIIMLMAFFIHMFYYLGWYLTDKLLSNDKDVLKSENV